MNNDPSYLPVRLAQVSLEGIEVDLEIGIEPQEHGRIQRLIIDVEVGFDERKTRIPDSAEGLKEGFDYATIRNCVLAATEHKTYLLETVANRIADSLLMIPFVLQCSVKVSKNRCWPDVASASIKISRESD